MNLTNPNDCHLLVGSTILALFFFQRVPWLLTIALIWNFNLM